MCNREEAKVNGICLFCPKQLTNPVVGFYVDLYLYATLFYCRVVVDWHALKV